jgi:acyl-coenzyme A synthetase/AMP-(fatty) acid ligase
MQDETKTDIQSHWIHFALRDGVAKHADRAHVSSEHSYQHGERIEWNLTPEAPAAFARAFWAALLQNKTPILGPLSSTGLSTDVYAPALIPTETQIPAVECPIGFLTSGSTGESRIFFRTWRSLVHEAQTIAAALKLIPGAPFFSFVPCHHLYGFIFAFLLPRLLGSSISHSTVNSSPLPVAPESRQHGVWVVTPALWNSLKMQLERQKLEDTQELILISSGAPWGQVRAKEVNQLCTSGCLTRVFDVLGSTESGGIGYTVFDGMKSQAGINLFKEAHLEIEDDGWTLRSPFLASGHHSITLDDEFIRTPEGRLIHTGRRDRIFKIAGKRYSLQSVEEAFKRFEGVTDARCFFISRDTVPKGGLLLAFLVGAAEACRAITREIWFKNRLVPADLPFPDRISYLDQWPTNSMGKVTIQDLAQFTDLAHWLHSETDHRTEVCS